MTYISKPLVLSKKSVIIGLAGMMLLAIVGALGVTQHAFASTIRESDLYSTMSKCRAAQDRTSRFATITTPCRFVYIQGQNGYVPGGYEYNFRE